MSTDNVSDSSIPTNSSSPAAASATSSTSLSNAPNPSGGQRQDQVSAQELITKRNWLQRSRDYILSTLHDNFWTLTACLIGFIIVGINSVKIRTECGFLGYDMEFLYCSRLTPQRLAIDRDCRAVLLAGDPCNDTLFGRRLNSLLQSAFSIQSNPERMAIVDRLFSLATLLTFWLNPHVVDPERRRGIAPFTTPLVVLCVIFEEKTLDGMLSTFDRVVEHVVVLRILMAGAAWLSGGPRREEGKEGGSVERDEEKNLITDHT